MYFLPAVKLFSLTIYGHPSARVHTSPAATPCCKGTSFAYEWLLTSVTIVLSLSIHQSHVYFVSLFSSRFINVIQWHFTATDIHTKFHKVSLVVDRLNPISPEMICSIGISRPQAIIIFYLPYTR